MRRDIYAWSREVSSDRARDRPYEWSIAHAHATARTALRAGQQARKKRRCGLQLTAMAPASIAACVFVWK